MARGSRFRLLEEQGYREREVYSAEDLEAMYEFLDMKTGDSRDRDNDDRDDGEFFPDIQL